MTANKVHQVVRVILLLFSVLGWVVFLVGFIKQAKVFKQTPMDLFKTIATPMWVFVVPPGVLYIFIPLHIFKPGENSGHIFHTIIMFIDLFYKYGASVVITFSLLGLKTSFLGFNRYNTILMLSGCITSTFFYWISTMLWPLFLLRRPYPQYYQELLEN